MSEKIHLSDAFCFQKAKVPEIWENNFILACYPILKYAESMLQKISTKSCEKEDKIVNRNQLIGLFILKDTIMEINNFVYDDSDNQIEIASVKIERK